MDRWEDRLVRLAGMPSHLESLRSRFPEDLARTRPGPDAFSYIEHVWHLADLEAEGFAERIRRLRAEEDPALPDFDGGRIAAERDYRARRLDAGLAEFAAARARNVETLRRSTPAERARGGVQEGAGPVTLGDLPARMLDHDDSHRSELDALVRAVGAA
jgi:hypothetical protein